MRSAWRLAGPVLTLVATLALAGCGGHGAGTTPAAAATTATTATTAGSGTAGTPDPTSPAPAASATPAAGAVVDQDTLRQITGVLDDTDRVLDSVDQEIAADPQE